MIVHELVMDAFAIVKGGNATAEWEDAVALSPNGRRFAVADGASSSYAAGPWGKALARNFTSGTPGVDHFADYSRWLKDVAFTWSNDHGSSSSDSYYVKEAARRGSFATLLCVEVTNRWKATAVGDTNLFHVRGEDLIGCFPLGDHAAFGRHPALVHSSGVIMGDPEEPLTATANVEAGDMLLAATDALAAWLLRADAQGRAHWGAFRSLESDEFRDAVGVLRRRGGLANDDVTLVRCLIGDAPQRSPA